MEDILAIMREEGSDYDNESREIGGSKGITDARGLGKLM